MRYRRNYPSEHFTERKQAEVLGHSTMAQKILLYLYNYRFTSIYVHNYDGAVKFTYMSNNIIFFAIKNSILNMMSRRRSGRNQKTVIRINKDPRYF